MRLSSVTTCAARANAASVAVASPASVSPATFEAHQRGRRIDAYDPRMCVRRADHRRVRLPGKVDVVRVTSGTGSEARIFPATYGLADAFRRRVGARSEKRHAHYFIANLDQDVVS